MTTTTPRPDPLSGARPAARTDPRATLRLGHPRELLALVPYLLGFQPRDSAVLVGLRPPARQVGLVARVDLPDLLRPDGAELAAALADHLRDDGTAEVVVVLYSGEGDPRDPERGLRATSGSRGARAAEVLRSGVAGVGPVTTWSVDRGSYVGLDCRDRGCCPVGGRPLADLSGGDLAGRLVSRRGGVAGSREELGLVRPAAPGPRRSAAAARSRWLDALLRADGPDAVLRWRQRSLAAWRGVLAAAGEPVQVPSAELGRVEAALLDPVVRDAVVLTLVAPEDAALPDALVRTGSAGATGAGAGPDAGTGPDEPGEEDEAGEHGGPAEPSRPGAEEGPAERVRPGAAGERAGRPGLCSEECEECDDVGDCGRGAASAAPADAAAGDPGAAEAGAVSARVRAALDRLVDPVRGREPREDVAHAGRAALERVVAHGRRDRQAPALTLLALLAWWDGDAVRASVLVERALDQDPGHRLAELLDRALGAGLPPGWVRRRC